MNKFRKILTMSLCFMLVAITIFASTFMQTQKAVAETYTTSTQQGYMARTITSQGNGIYKVDDEFNAYDYKKPLRVIFLIDTSASCWKKYVLANAKAMAAQFASEAPGTRMSIVLCGKRTYTNEDNIAGFSRYSTSKFQGTSLWHEGLYQSVYGTTVYNQLVNGECTQKNEPIQEYCWTLDSWTTSATTISNYLDQTLDYTGATNGSATPLDIGYSACMTAIDEDSGYSYNHIGTTHPDTYVNVVVTFSDFKSTWQNGDDNTQKKYAVSMAKALQTELDCTTVSMHTNCDRHTVFGHTSSDYPNAFVCAKLSSSNYSWSGTTWIDGVDKYDVPLVMSSSDSSFPFYYYVDDNNESTSKVSSLISALKKIGKYNSPYSDSTNFKATVDSRYFTILNTTSYPVKFYQQSRTTDTNGSYSETTSYSKTISSSSVQVSDVPVLTNAVTSSGGKRYKLTYYVQKTTAPFSAKFTTKLINNSSFIWTSTTLNSTYHYVDSISSSNITFDATTYKINFDTGGGTSVSSITKTWGTDISLPSTAPTKSGWTFAGWSTNSSINKTASSVVFTAGSQYDPTKLTSTKVSGYNGSGSSVSYTENTSSVTLYAVWKAAVTYNANGGTSSSATYPYTVTYYRTGSGTHTFSTRDASAELTKSGAAFKNWNSNSSGTGTTYTVGQTVNLSNMTLYATYAAKNFTIYYKGNGANGGDAEYSSTHTVGDGSYILYNNYTKSYTTLFDEGSQHGTSGDHDMSGGPLVSIDNLYENYAELNCYSYDTRTYYSFAGWKTPSNNIYQPYTSIANIPELNPTTSGQTYVFNATWTPTSLTVPQIYAWGAKGTTWESSDGTTITAGDKYTPTENKDFYPVLTSKTYTLVYDPGEGEGTAFSKTYSYYNSDGNFNEALLSVCSFIKTGCQFGGWNFIAPDGSEWSAGTADTLANDVYDMYFNEYNGMEDANAEYMEYITDNVTITLKATYLEAGYELSLCNDTDHDGASSEEKDYYLPLNDFYTLPSIDSVGFKGKADNVYYCIDDNYKINNTSVSAISASNFVTENSKKYYKTDAERIFLYWDGETSTFSDSETVYSLCYEDGDSYTMFAQWSGYSYFDVPSLTVDGYDFLGWSTTEGKTEIDASTDYLVGQNYELHSSSIYLYPVLKPTVVSVTAYLYEMDTTGTYSKTQFKTWDAEVNSTITNPFTSLDTTGKSWATTSPDGFPAICTSATVTEDGATLYCYLARKQYTVTFYGYIYNYIRADDYHYIEEEGDNASDYDFPFTVSNTSGISISDDLGGKLSTKLYYEQEIDLSKVVLINEGSSVWSFGGWVSRYQRGNLTAYPSDQIVTSSGTSCYYAATGIYKQGTSSTTFHSVFTKDITINCYYFDSSKNITLNSGTEILSKYQQIKSVYISDYGVTPGTYEAEDDDEECETCLSTSSVTPSDVPDIDVKNQALTCRSGFTFKGWANALGSATTVNEITCDTSTTECNLYALYDATASVQYYNYSDLALDDISDGNTHTIGTPDANKNFAYDTGAIVVGANSKTGYSVVQGFNYTNLDLGFKSDYYRMSASVYVEHCEYLPDGTASNVAASEHAVHTIDGEISQYYSDGVSDSDWYDDDEQDITVYADTTVLINFTGIRYWVKLENNVENYPTAPTGTSTVLKTYSPSITTLYTAGVYSNKENSNNILIGWSTDKVLTSSSVILSPRNITQADILPLLSDKYHNQNATDGTNRIHLYPHYVTIDIESDTNVVIPNSTVNYTVTYSVMDNAPEVTLSNFVFSDGTDATGTITTDVSSGIVLNSSNKTATINVTEEFTAVEKGTDITRQMVCDVTTTLGGTVEAKPSITLSGNYYNIYYYDGSTLLFTDSKNYIPGEEFTVSTTKPTSSNKYFIGWTFPASTLENISVDSDTGTMYINGDLIIYSEWTTTSFITSSTGDTVTEVEAGTLKPGDEYYYVINISNTLASSGETYKFLIPEGASWNANYVKAKINNGTEAQLTSETANTCVQAADHDLDVLEIHINEAVSSVRLVIPMKVDTQPSTAEINTVIYEEKTMSEETVEVIYGSSYFDLYTTSNATMVDTYGLSFTNVTNLKACAHTDTLTAFYTITYVNGSATSGTLPVDNNVYFEGNNATISSTLMSYPGYTCLGWVVPNGENGGGTVYKGGETVVFSTSASEEDSSSILTSSLVLEPLFVNVEWTATDPDTGNTRTAIRTHETVTYKAKLTSLSYVSDSINIYAEQPDELTLSTKTYFADNSSTFNADYVYSNTFVSAGTGNALVGTLFMKCTNTSVNASTFSNKLTVTIGDKFTLTKTVSLNYSKGCKLTYVVDAGDITAPVDDTIYDYNTNATLLAPIGTDSKYAFSVWRYDDVWEFLPGDEITMSDDRTVYGDCLYFNKTSLVDTGSVAENSVITYTISLCSTLNSTNFSEITDVTIEDTIPDGTTFYVSATPDNTGTAPEPDADGKITWTFDEMSNDSEIETQSVVFAVKVNSQHNDGTAFESGETISNTATASFATIDNNTHSVTSNTVTDQFSQYKVHYVFSSEDSYSGIDEYYYVSPGETHTIKTAGNVSKTVDDEKVYAIAWHDGTNTYGTGTTLTVNEDIDLYPVYIIINSVRTATSDSTLLYEPLDTTTTIVYEVTNSSGVSMPYNFKLFDTTYFTTQKVSVAAKDTDSWYTELAADETDSTYYFTSSLQKFYVKYEGVFKSNAYGITEKTYQNVIGWSANNNGSYVYRHPQTSLSIHVNPSVTLVMSPTASNGVYLCNRTQTNYESAYNSNFSKGTRKYSYSYSISTTGYKVKFVHIPYGTDFNIPYSQTVTSPSYMTTLEDYDDGASTTTQRYISLINSTSNNIRGICFDIKDSALTTAGLTFADYRNSEGSYYYTVNGQVGPFFLCSNAESSYYTSGNMYITAWDTGGGTLRAACGYTKWCNKRTGNFIKGYSYSWRTDYGYTFTEGLKSRAGNNSYISAPKGTSQCSLNTLYGVKNNTFLYAVYTSVYDDFTANLSSAVPNSHVYLEYTFPYAQTSNSSITYTNISIPKIFDIDDTNTTLEYVSNSTYYFKFKANSLLNYNNSAAVYLMVNNKVRNGSSTAEASAQRLISYTSLYASATATYTDDDGNVLFTMSYNIRPAASSYVPGYGSIKYSSDDPDVTIDDTSNKTGLKYFISNSSGKTLKNYYTTYNSETRTNDPHYYFSKKGYKFMYWEDRNDEVTTSLLEFYRKYLDEDEIITMSGFVDDGTNYGFYDEDGTETQITYYEIYTEGSTLPSASATSNIGYEFDMYPVFESSAELPETGSTQIVSLGILISALCAGYVFLKKREKDA